MSTMPLVYVAGPYRAPSEYQVRRNIREAEKVAVSLWKAGYAVICPHKNTGGLGGAADDSVFLEGDLEMMCRCDVVFAIDRWKESSGAKIEIERARVEGIPVVFSYEELDELAKSGKSSRSGRSVKVRP
jgi:nucleoside 2-deoxyribosyltransferase